MDIGMPHWRNGKGRAAAPIPHLSADRLGDMVDAVRSNPPDLATLPRPNVAVREAPSVEFYPPPTSPAYEPPYTPPPPVEIDPDYTWADSVPPPAAFPAEDTEAAFEIPMPEFEIPASVEPARASRAPKKKKGGRHRQPASLRHFGRGLSRSLRSALVTPRVIALVGMIGLIVAATAVLGVL